MSDSFTINADHLKLLKYLNISWNDYEFGAPTVDCKRPYGNSSVIDDMVDILGAQHPRCPHCNEFLSDTHEEHYVNLHNEMQTVLQIICSTGKVEKGLYTCEDRSRDWKKNE